MIQELSHVMTVLQTTYNEADPNSKIALLAACWMMRDTLDEILDDGKERLRTKGAGSTMTQFGTFTVSPAKTEYKIQKPEKLKEMLGGYFNLLFNPTYRTVPKFEEIYDSLPEELRSILLAHLEQITHRPRVSFKESGV